MTSTLSLWEFLSRDVAFLGGPSSPLLSWIGVFGIIFFFVWQVFKLRREVRCVQGEFEKIQSILGALVHERGDVEYDRFTQQTEKPLSHSVGREADRRQCRDRDDLQRLDGEIEKIPMFRAPWAQYRRTLIVEQVPWFMEPRIFSTRPAKDVLTQEGLMGSHINFAFYQHFPSLITGIGLLLTFLALFVGLGKLHAEGSEIIGIQGLINGLAGKFLTSIVGLMLATVFTLIEKPIMSRLKLVHQSFLEFVDQLFPRKTVEQMLEQLTIVNSQQQHESVTPNQVSLPSGGEYGMSGLTQAMSSLTSSIQSFAKFQETAQVEIQQMKADFPGAMREEIQIAVRELHKVIHDLTMVLTDLAQHQSSRGSVQYSRPFLWAAAPGSQTPPEDNASGNTKVWPRWPRFTTHRRTG